MIFCRMSELAWLLGISLCSMTDKILLSCLALTQSLSVCYDSILLACFNWFGCVESC